MSIYEASITNPKKQSEFYKDLSEQLQRENEKLRHYKTLYQNLKEQKEELRSYLKKEISDGRSEDDLWLMGVYDEDKNILEKLEELEGTSNENI